MYEVNEKQMELRGALNELHQLVDQDKLDGLIILSLKRLPDRMIQPMAFFSLGDFSEYEWIGILECVKDQLKLF